MDSALTPTISSRGHGPFRDRRDAGRVLAGLLERYRGRQDVVVLALPRGGVPVAYEVAIALGAPLDVFVVRKLGVPSHDELAMGAIASGGVAVVNDDIARGLGLSPADFRQVAQREGRELARRERVYREGRPMPDVSGGTAILVDDGLATGASMRAALQALRRLEPARIVVAVPAAPESTCQELAGVVDQMVCATTPSPFFAVGRSYWDFEQTTDDEVRELLRAARSRASAARVHRPADIAAVRAEAVPLEGGVPDGEALRAIVGDARLVLIGEATHGTHEFYAVRAAITRRLIEDIGFCAVAAEADWPDAYRVNRFVRARGDDPAADAALGSFERFPTWIWRNTVLAEFVTWLREHNDRAGDERRKAGFYGLDLYGLQRSIADVIAYLDRVDPAAAARARQRYACLEDVFGDDGQAYGYAAAFGAGRKCEQQVVGQLVDLQRHALEYARRDGLMAQDEQFYGEQNARAVKAAEEYYRTMFGGRATSWNLRDRHMADTLNALADHLTRQRGTPARIVVWAHNSHVGDARATERASLQELTLGQLVRQRDPDDVVLLGLTTFGGTVTAAGDWDGPVERKAVRPALPGSVEARFHDARGGAFLLPFARAPRTRAALRPPRLERAIGVVYRPDTERRNHYFRARVAEQFDAVIHIDETRAVEPLDRTGGWERGEVPDTYPFAV
jgi:erythromycin esterase-like protein/adenine/guanine phosphoribosyltransferase-like PRPP-binding protein